MILLCYIQRLVFGCLMRIVLFGWHILKGTIHCVPNNVHVLNHTCHQCQQENRTERKLLYACRLCRYTEHAQGPLIYQNILKKEVGNVLHTVPSAVSDDPTLPRSQNAHCEKCGHNEAVFFQSDTSDVRNDTLALIFVCCNCDHKWVA